MNAQRQAQVIIKKYANRRLYDTETSQYITLEDLCARVKAGDLFVVIDAKTGQDLTRQVLTQIILERELNGHTLLPIEFLRSVIRFYDDKMQGALQQYLDASMKAFMGNQDRVRSMMGKAAAGGGEFSPFSQFEEATRQNVALFEKAVDMFNPFNAMFGLREEKEEAVASQSAQARRRRR